jgi:hypothetical protein
MSARVKGDQRARNRQAGGSELESGLAKDLLVEAISGVSTYAHHARRFTMIDSSIDAFVAKTLARLSEDRYLTVDETIQLLREVEKLLDRAKNLYHWSCEVFCRPQKEIQATIVPTEELDADGFVEKGRARLREIRGAKRENQDIRYWEDVCITKLFELSASALKIVGDEKKRNGILGFLHKSLSGIAEGRTVFELVAMVQSMEKESMKLVSESTMEEKPESSETEKRQREMSMNSEPAPPNDGSCETGLTG